jgi:hypothetical protein
MATAFLMSHHAFRRDLGCFGRALGRVPASDKSRLEALREEWRSFRGALHGHHEMEDTRVFPHMRGQHPELAPAIDRLSAEHQRIDPLLLRGDQAFAEVFDVPAARTVIAELTALLDEHLAFEEATVVPNLRAANEFPAPGNDDEVAMFAQGFAWSSQGVAPTVLERLNDMLPAKLKDRLPAARAEFAERWQRAWQGEPVTASTTSVPAPAAQPK